MKLYSTKNRSHVVSLKEAVFKGLPPDNGLYMPVDIPELPKAFFDRIETLSLQEIALEVSSALIGEEVSKKDLKDIVSDVLTFDAPLVNVHDTIFALELFHGPSFAFKDFGARFMARLLAFFLSQEQNKEINILVATSGDTGSAVAQGFLNMPGIKVTILYPSKKVSDIQEKQLTTLGHNITALEIDGTFDDCQRLVKQAFLDPELNAHVNLSSANSINISRLIPQSFYYFYAYSRLKTTGKPLVFSVPSGNFGNLSAGLIAKRMGLPVARFIASTNANDIVPSYLDLGTFSPRPSVSTVSNAMDVGNPSNFYRLSALYDNDIDKIRHDIVGKRFTDAATKKVMKQVYEQYGYILDPHGAVAYLGLKEYMQSYSNEVNGIFLETAHPCKFLEVVEETIEQKIDLPERLKEMVNKPKKAIFTSNEFKDLKQYLLN
jgi:threonine synthase